MKKIILVIITILLVACNAEIKDDSIPTSKIEAITNLGELDSVETTNKVDSSITTPSNKPINSSKLLLIARGTEPGWYAEFYNNKGKILLDYGKDSLLVNCDFEKITEKDFSKTIAITQNNKSVNLSVTIKNKKCVESGSGEEKDRYIELKLENKIYKGCATLK